MHLMFYFLFSELTLLLFKTIFSPLRILCLLIIFISLPQFFSYLPHYLHIQFCSLKKKTQPLETVCAAWIRLCGLPLEHGWLTRGHTLGKTLLPNFLAGVRTLYTTPISMLGFSLAWVCTYFVHSVTNTVSSHVQLPHCVQKVVSL